MQPHQFFFSKSLRIWALGFIEAGLILQNGEEEMELGARDKRNARNESILHTKTALDSDFAFLFFSCTRI